MSSIATLDNGTETVQPASAKIEGDVAEAVAADHSAAEQISIYRLVLALVARLRWRRLLRSAVVVLLDVGAVGTALLLLLRAYHIEMIGNVEASLQFVGVFCAVSAAALVGSGLYRQNWRFVSLADCNTLMLTVACGLTIAWVATLGIPKLDRYGMQLVPLVVVHFCVTTIVMLVLRMLRRAARTYDLRDILQSSGEAKATRRYLLIGDAEWSLSVIEMMRADKSAYATVIGVLLPSREDTISRLAGAPVLGNHDRVDKVIEDLVARGQRPDGVIVFDDGMNLSKRELARVVSKVKDHGLELLRINDPWGKLLEGRPKLETEELPLTELLGRKEVNLTSEAINRQIFGQCVLVTGAGGTIGSELVRQLATFRPAKLVLVEHCEFNLYSIEMRLREMHSGLDIVPELCNIRDIHEVEQVFARHLPTIVYHAAALKHVPMVEANPCAGAHTNIVGTRNIADAVCRFSVRAMVQVSTDKAVNPVGLMGATKRVGELYCQSLDLCGTDDADAPRFMTVRFGNVLGSSGSVVPLFKRQLLEGRPLTVTHPDIERFFMTVREAVHLILESSSKALEENSKRGSVFVLDMGAPVKIVDLARRMIRLFGLEPDVDVPIQFTGLRPGEKLYEELFDTCEEQIDSGIHGLHEARSRPIPLPLISAAIDHLGRAIEGGDEAEVLQITHNLVKLPSSGVDMNTLFGKAPATWRDTRPARVKEA